MRAWTLASRPAGLPNDSNFAMIEAPDAPLGPNEFRVANSWLSVDPYMRGRMSDGPSYAAPVPIDGVMEGGTRVQPSGGVMLKALAKACGV